MLIVFANKFNAGNKENSNCKINMKLKVQNQFRISTSTIDNYLKDLHYTFYWKAEL